ncbi:MAG: transcriptional regulator [Rhizobiaceae bacterium]|nr:transcriptional regulator [Rhizobiaceae bacterium]
MKTLRIRIETLDDVRSAVSRVLKSGNPEAEAGLSFASYEDMHHVLSPKRLAIVKAMTGRPPTSIREIARLVGRDFKGVHTDVTALVNAGVFDRGEKGIEFPYETIHVEFDIEAAA